MPKKRVKLPLSKTHPKLAKEADGWDPRTIYSGTHTKVKWKCFKGHTWQAEVRTRAIRGLGCAACSGQRVIKGETDLLTTHPKLAKEADGWDPSILKAGSNKKVKWKCKKGHTWTTSPNSRTNYIKKTGKPLGCPNCSGQKLLEGFNDLATTHPKIAKEAYRWNPKSLSIGSSQKKNWQCKSGHVWEAIVYSRQKNGCPYCSGRFAIKGKNDLKTINPKLAKELVDQDASQLTSASGKKVLWRCKLGHTWRASVGARKRGNGCPICSGRRLLEGFNDLATTHPEIARQAFNWNPKTVSAGMGVKKEWICELGHVWKNSPNSRTSGNKTNLPLGCPVCSGQKLLKGFNDLSTTHPLLASTAYGWDPTTVQAGSRAKKLWKCSSGHVTKALITNKVRRQSGANCAVCSNSELLQGFNDMATTHPNLALQAYGWDPKTVVAGTTKRLKWKCKLDHTWTTSGNNRIQGNDCPVCANKVVIIGFNDLGTTHPQLAAELINGDPKSVTAGSGKKFTWRCYEGHTWITDVQSRSHGTGCPSCAQGGFDPNSEAWLYLIKNDYYGMLQIGISNYPENRLKVHKRNGWELIELRGPLQGDVAYAWEQSIMKMLQNSGANLGDETIDGKFEGFTEAWSKSTFPVKSIKQLMQLTEEFEEEIKSYQR